MTNALIIAEKSDTIKTLKTKLSKFHPEISLCGIMSIYSEEIKNFINDKLDLLILDIDASYQNCLKIIHDNFFQIDFETIFISSSPNHALEAIKYRASGYILKPISDKDMFLAIRNAKMRINDKKGNENKNAVFNYFQTQIPPNHMIGIPTMEGFEFIPIHDIIRCEGLQKCTKIVTKKGINLISSYSIGEFKKILEKHYFFSPHKSHLINLFYITKYSRIGLVQLADNSQVPVSRRKRSQFLEKLPHL